MSLAGRVLIGLLTVAGTLIVLDFLDRIESNAQVKIDCIEPNERIKVREIILNGIDDGLRAKVADLYENWVRDPTDQPKRAQVGLTNAISAHSRGRAGALRWMPPPCDEGGK